MDANFSMILKAIDITKDCGWRELWIENDRIPIVKVFSNRSLVPRGLRNMWIANIGFNANSNIFDQTPIGIRGDFVKNKLDIHLFKFSSF